MTLNNLSHLLAGAGCALLTAVLLTTGCIVAFDEEIVAEIIDDVTCGFSMCGGESCEGFPADGCCADTEECALSLLGHYEDGWGTGYLIGAAGIAMNDAVFSFTIVSEHGQYAVAENGWSNRFSPGLWSRFDWTWDEDGALWLCQTAFDAATEADALATVRADGTDPANSGCGGFSWSRLSTFELMGTWADDWGTGHEITLGSWVQSSDFGVYRFAISTWSNLNSYVIAQNGTENPDNPDAWSRFDWVWDGEGTLWVCQTAYAALTEAEALETPAADASDPANTGCGGFGWSRLNPAT